MHHARRRPTTVLLTLLAALALVLTACGGEDSGGETTADGGEETAASDTGDDATGDPNEGSPADSDATPPSTVGETETEGEDDTAAFLEDPSYYLTEQPTLTGTVQEVVGTSGFTLGGDDWGDVRVFVAAAEETLSDVATGDEVTVSGELLEVREDEITEIAARATDELGVSVDERYLESLAGQYVLIPDTFVEGAGDPTETTTGAP